MAWACRCSTTHSIASGNRSVTADIAIVRFFGALLAATLGTVVLPRLAKLLFSNATMGWHRLLTFNLLLLLFWHDHFAFPLSDFPALLAFSIGLLGLLSSRPAGHAVAGLGLGLAVNMRPAYIPALLGAVVFAGLAGPPRKLSLGAGALAVLLSGAFLASVPQMLVNHRNHDDWSPAVLGSEEILLSQLTWSLRAQRYETYIGSDFPVTARRLL